MAERILRRPEVERRTGLGRSALYDLIRKGAFPAPVRLTTRAVGWVEAEVSSWIEGRAAQRDAVEPVSGR